MRHGSLYLEIWESTDLVHWSDQRHVRVSADTAGMTWAPEATYDPTLGAYVVYWASNLYRADDPDHTGSTYPRMMYATTRDFHTFSEPKVWNDPGKGVIDATVIRHGDTYYRFTTDDKLIGSCDRDIVQERSTSLTAVDLPGTKPRNWQLVSDCIRTKAGTDWVEGPTVFKSNTEDKWYLFADETPKRGYLPFETTDLAGGKWRMPTDYALPANPRHGTVLPITQAEYDRLLRTYLPAELVDSVAEVTARTPAGTAPQLPASVTATFADGTTKQTQVTWDEIKSSDYASAGTFVVRGTIRESGTIRARATVTVFTPDSANAGPAVRGAEGAAIRLAGRTTGSAGAAWSYRPLSGVDRGATCKFADPKTAGTTITCTDDGIYEVVLKSGTATGRTRLTVINKIPVITAAAGPAPVKAGRPVTVSATFTDAGKHDTHACTVAWSGGNTSKGSLAGGRCTATHTYRRAGTYRVKVTVTDDDGGAVSRTVTVVVRPTTGGGAAAARP
jgi:hypothetical protein